MKKTVIGIILCFIFMLSNLSVAVTIEKTQEDMEFKNNYAIDKQETSILNDQWEIETVDFSGDVGWYSDITVSDSGEVFISYYDNKDKHLNLATLKDDRWDLEIVDPQENTGKYGSIDADSSGNPHISYYDEENQDLKYAKYSNNEWNIETVDFQGDVGLDTSIVVDSKDNPHISYYDYTNGNLKYATKQQSSWTIKTIHETDDIGQGTSIAVDSFDNLHISYTDKTGSKLYYAKSTEGQWQTEIADANCKVSGKTTIATDMDSLPHIGYYDLSDHEKWKLKHCYKNQDEWLIETIDPNLRKFYNEWGASITIDQQNNVHVGYYAWDTWNLNYAYKTCGIWYVETVDSEGLVGAYASIALDNQGYPHISYKDNSNIYLKHAKKTQYTPNIPIKPTGEKQLKINKTYYFATKTNDLDNDKIKYGWDWNGDDIIDEWTEYHNSDETIEISHKYQEKGEYEISVKAMDENGYTSEFSEALLVSVIKRKIKNKFQSDIFIESIISKMISLLKG